ncbi:MAG TPA: 7TM diverse intracellular signaling domain-containing protein [Ramlibacter sp.]|nr:7TM diverse intracellular signaling domain-containing protein [Ramlibacter sp.]
MFKKLLRWVSVLVIVLCAPWAGAQQAGAPANGRAPPISVSAAGADLSAQAAAWIEQGDGATIQQVAKGLGEFRIPSGRVVHRLEKGRTLWIHLNVRAEPRAPADWVLKFPMSVLDSVTVFQSDSSGAWKGQTAGDTVHMGLWPEPGRYPFFRVALPQGETRELYLRVQHSTPVSLPIRMVTVATHDLRTQTEYLGLGAVFGAMALLIGMCALRGWILRDSGYGWYTLYALVSLLAVTAYTGVAAQLIWTDAVQWIDASPGVLAMLAASSALLIVRSLSGIVTRHRWLSRMMLGAAIIGPVLASVYLAVPRPPGVAMLGLFLVTVAVLSLTAATLVMRRGDDVGVWMMAGSLPLAFAVMLVLASVFGLIQASWVTEYALVSGIALGLPMLLGALHNRSRERRGAEFRQIASSSQDALTGLLTARVFQARLAQAIARYRQRGEDAAVMLIEIANYPWIKETYGSAVAEQCLLRGVILLRRLVRDVDTTGRVGEARFGLILEGISSRAVVSDRATRLLAAGLRPGPQGTTEVTLQFHVAAALLDEQAKDADSLVFAMGDLLSAMSGRTRHPIRFVDSSAPATSAPEAAPIMQA